MQEVQTKMSARLAQEWHIRDQGSFWLEPRSNWLAIVASGSRSQNVVDSVEISADSRSVARKGELVQVRRGAPIDSMCYEFRRKTAAFGSVDGIAYDCNSPTLDRRGGLVRGPTAR
jgi:hypothetical protein